jgi:hypothetical protein
MVARYHHVDKLARSLVCYRSFAVTNDRIVA